MQRVIRACLPSDQRAANSIRQLEAKVGGQEAVTPISLRVTMILRPEDGVWKIVHRHADPITTAQPTESIVTENGTPPYMVRSQVTLHRSPLRDLIPRSNPTGVQRSSSSKPGALPVRHRTYSYTSRRSVSLGLGPATLPKLGGVSDMLQPAGPETKQIPWIRSLLVVGATLALVITVALIINGRSSGLEGYPAQQPTPKTTTTPSRGSPTPLAQETPNEPKTTFTVTEIPVEPPTTISPEIPAERASAPPK